jgi:hypothetical protein
MKETEDIKRTEKAGSEGFRLWYVTPRITQFLDSVHRPIFLYLENATFRRRSGTLLGFLERANPNHWSTEVEEVEVCLGVRRPSGTFDQIFFLLEIPFRHLRVCYFVAPSLTRGRVCNLL